MLESVNRMLLKPFISFPHQTFKPLVGKSVYNSITAVEFLVDKQLDFVTEDSAFQPYQVRIQMLLMYLVQFQCMYMVSLPFWC